MKYLEKLDFSRNILKELRISGCTVENPDEYITPEVDLHLRKELFGYDNYAHYLMNTFSAVKEHTVYRFFDEYDCHYVFLMISESERSYFFVGPYLTDIPRKERIDSLLITSEDPQASEFLLHHHLSLPIIEDENLLLSMMTALAKELWETTDDIRMEYIDYAIPDGRSPITVSFMGTASSDTRLDLEALERNYENEK